MFRAINTCVLGTGLSGLTFHIPFILALPGSFTLQSVLERNPKTEGGKVKERFGITVKIHTSFEDVLADPAIELIIVGTPNDTHYNFAKAALEAGKHGTRPHHNSSGWAEKLMVIQFWSTSLLQLPLGRPENSAK
jgi:predicted dehydrogenase